MYKTMESEQSEEPLETDDQQEQAEIQQFAFPHTDSTGVYDSVNDFYDIRNNMDNKKDYKTLSDDEKLIWMILFCRTENENHINKFTRQERLLYGSIKHAFDILLTLRN